MAATAKATLKTFFETGDFPSQAQFYALIDTLASLLEDVANNLTTTAAGKVLDARQGKALKDLIDTLTTAVNNKPTVVAAPASSTASGTAGQIAYDGDYFYQCVATDTWRRTPLADWS